MERWVYDSDSGRPGRRRGLFVWLLDVAFAVVTALVALLLLFMYLAPYVSPDASWVFSVSRSSATWHAVRRCVSIR